MENQAETEEIFINQEEDKKQRYIYIVLTRSKTILSRSIGLFTGMPYSHASISYCDDLAKMYSFGRRWVHNPLIGGFVEESCEFGFFKTFSNTACCVYRIPVSEEKYYRCVEIIDGFKAEPFKYKYNHLGLLTIPMGLKFAMKNRFVCSHFVAYVLGLSDIIEFNKNVSLVTPTDLAYIKGAKKIYAGALQTFHI